MTQSIGVVAGVTCAAGCAGMGGVAALGTSGDSDNGRIDMLRIQNIQFVLILIIPDGYIDGNRAFRNN